MDLTAAQRDQFHKDGFLILQGFFAAERIKAFKDHVDELWRQRRRADNPLTIDTSLRSRLWNGVYRAAFRSVPDEARQLFFKLNDAHLVDPMVQGLSADPGLLAAIETLLGHRPVICNSLLFEWGSEQDLHFDTFYMPSPTPNMMTASWIAIDPVTPDNGPLVYYPGSHLIEPFRFSDGQLNAIGAEMPAANAHIRDIIRDYRLEEMRFYPQPGDVLIWHAQLLHGGGAITSRAQKRTSLVTHYFTTLDFSHPKDCVDLGDQRYILAKTHQYGIDGSLIPRTADRLNRVEVTAQKLAGVPPDFDPASYLLNNPDLLEADVDPYEHYADYGLAELRPR
jgi:phytanoyl-CoA hydroxylase